jgi:hypothetical protein
MAAQQFLEAKHNLGGVRCAAEVRLCPCSLLVSLLPRVAWPRSGILRHQGHRDDHPLPFLRGRFREPLGHHGGGEHAGEQTALQLSVGIVTAGDHHHHFTGGDGFPSQDREQGLGQQGALVQILDHVDELMAEDLFLIHSLGSDAGGAEKDDGLFTVPSTHQHGVLGTSGIRVGHG